MAWRNSLEDKLVSLRDLLITRIEAMDKAAEVLSQNVNRVPTLLDRETSRLTALFDERTGNIRSSIRERDDQARQDKVTASSAAEHALASLKELIASQNSSNALALAKAESSTAHALEALNAIINATKDGLSNEINNLKQRLDRGEGADRGERMATADTHSNIGSISLIIGCFVGVMGIVVAILPFTSAHYSSPAANTNPLMGADTKRADDMVSRMDALSARLNALQAKPPAPNN